MEEAKEKKAKASTKQELSPKQIKYLEEVVAKAKSLGVTVDALIASKLNFFKNRDKVAIDEAVRKLRASDRTAENIDRIKKQATIYNEEIEMIEGLKG